MNSNCHIVKANKGFSLIGYTKMDLGIAKYHFEIGAGKETLSGRANESKAKLALSYAECSRHSIIINV